MCSLAAVISNTDKRILWEKRVFLPWHPWAGWKVTPDASSCSLYEWHRLLTDFPRVAQKSPAELRFPASLQAGIQPPRLTSTSVFSQPHRPLHQHYYSPFESLVRSLGSFQDCVHTDRLSPLRTVSHLFGGAQTRTFVFFRFRFPAVDVTHKYAAKPPLNASPRPLCVFLFTYFGNDVMHLGSSKHLILNVIFKSNTKWNSYFYFLCLGV